MAKALEVLGDAWTLLVVREAFLGSQRFKDFEAALKISKNVLTHRLGLLCRRGVLERYDAGQSGPRYHYRLTPMGKDLATVMTALRQWGDRWVVGRDQVPVWVIDRRTGRPIPPVRILGEDGHVLRAAELELRPGPGASRATLARAERATRARARPQKERRRPSAGRGADDR